MHARDQRSPAGLPEILLSRLLQLRENLPEWEGIPLAGRETSGPRHRSKIRTRKEGWLPCCSNICALGFLRRLILPRHGEKARARRKQRTGTENRLEFWS